MRTPGEGRDDHAWQVLLNDQFTNECSSLEVMVVRSTTNLVAHDTKESY